MSFLFVAANSRLCYAHPARRPIQADSSSPVHGRVMSNVDFSCGRMNGTGIPTHPSRRREIIVARVGMLAAVLEVEPLRVHATNVASQATSPQTAVSARGKPPVLLLRVAVQMVPPASGAVGRATTLLRARKMLPVVSDRPDNGAEEVETSLATDAADPATLRIAAHRVKAVAGTGEERNQEEPKRCVPPSLAQVRGMAPAHFRYRRARDKLQGASVGLPVSAATVGSQVRMLTRRSCLSVVSEAEERWTQCLRAGHTRRNCPSRQ